MARTVTLTSLFILVGGYSLFFYEDNYGPKDQIIYLWPVPVMLLMGIALIVLAFQFFAFLSRL